MAIEVPVVMLPDAHLRKVLSHSQANPTLLSPEYVRNFILRDVQRVRTKCSTKTRHAAALLGYCLADVDDASPETLASPSASMNRPKLMNLTMVSDLDLDKCRLNQISMN